MSAPLAGNWRAFGEPAESNSSALPWCLVEALMRKCRYQEGASDGNIKGQPSDAALPNPRVAFRPALRILAATKGLVELPVWFGATPSGFFGADHVPSPSIRGSRLMGRRFLFRAALTLVDRAMDLPVRWLELLVQHRRTFAEEDNIVLTPVQAASLLDRFEASKDKARAKRAEHCV